MSMMLLPIYISVWLNTAFEWSLFLVGTRDVTGSNLGTNIGYPAIYEFHPSHQTCAEVLLQIMTRRTPSKSFLFIIHKPWNTLFSNTLLKISICFTQLYMFLTETIQADMRQ
jgi:hypothetical protein